MVHHPKPIAAELPPYAVSLAQRARDQGVVLYAGAGLSMAEPSGLPSGAALSRQIHARLAPSFPVLDGVDDADLVAVSDAVAGLAGGEDALRRVAARSAEFTTASPSYGHYVLAGLLLEGVLDVLTTNWDDCVERGGGRERVYSVVTRHDLLNVVGRRILKIHGCATQPSSLLLTTAHLATPPSWVRDETRARLGHAVVAFVGIGDVAGYVEERLREAIADIGNVDNIRVVGPGLDTGWDESEWSGLVPDLAQEHRIDASADEFLECLGAAYVRLTLAEVASSLDGTDALSTAFANGVAGLCRHDALTVLAWARGAEIVPASGVAVLGAAVMAEAIAALGSLSGEDFTITRDAIVETATGAFEILVSVGAKSADRMRREAQNRLEAHVSKGIPAPRFLVAGGIGWAAPADLLPGDIVSEGDAADVLDGPMFAEPEIIRACEVLAA